MNRRRPRSTRHALLTLALSTSVAFSGVFLSAGPSIAAFEGSAAEEGLVKAVDAVLIRPMSLIRVFVGAALLIPSSFFAAGTGLDGIRTAYDVLITAPMEYAFDRKLGEF